MAPLSAKHLGELRALAETDDDNVVVQVPITQRPSDEQAWVQDV
jgi:hypothetical protein